MARLIPGYGRVNTRFKGWVGRHIGRIPPTMTRRRKPRDGELDPEYVEPPRPKGLSGGAAAELEYDD